MAVTRLHSAAPPIRREPGQLVIPIGTLLDDWREEVATLALNHKHGLTWLGDAYIYAEEHFDDALIAETVSAYAAESIPRAVRTCRSVPPQRRYGCGHSFLQAVEKLSPEEQDEILALAAKGDWPREAMREELRERKAKKEAEERGTEVPQRPMLRLASPEPAPANDEHYASDNLRAPTPEAEGSNNPVTAAEAVVLLEQFAASPVVPPAVRAAFHVLIDERDTLLKIANSAKLSIDMAKGFVSPKLRDAVRAWESHLSEPAPAAS